MIKEQCTLDRNWLLHLNWINTFFDFLNQVIHLKRMERCLTMQHFVKDYSQGPSINLWWIRCFIQYLRWTVKRSTTNTQINSIIIKNCWQSKVRYFNHKSCFKQVNTRQKLFFRNSICMVQFWIIREMNQYIS